MEDKTVTTIDLEALIKKEVPEGATSETSKTSISDINYSRFELVFDDKNYIQSSFNARQNKQREPFIGDFFSFKGHVMAKIVTAAKPERITWWIWRDGHWVTSPNFLHIVERFVRGKLVAIGSDESYIKIARHVTINKVIPCAVEFHDFDDQRFIDSQCYPIFTPNKMILLKLPENEGDIICEDKPIDPQAFNRWSLDTEPKNIPTPIFDKFMDEISCGDRDWQETVMQMIGYCLTPIKLEAKFFFLLGNGANGKSTLQAIIQRILGHRNCSSLALEDINGQTIESLSNALANLAGETAAGRFNESKLKGISDAESTDVNPKYRDSYTVIPRAKLIFAMNKLPVCTDLSDAFWRRCIVIPFNYRVERRKQNTLFVGTMHKEIPGITFKALEALKRVISRKGKIYECGAVLAASQQYKNDSSTVCLFLDELKTAMKEGDVSIFRPYINPVERIRAEFKQKKDGKVIFEITVKRDHLHASFCEWCARGKFKAFSSREFYSRLSDPMLWTKTIDGAKHYVITIDRQADTQIEAF